MSDVISIHHENGIAVIRLSNAPVNALGHAMRSALHDACKSLSSNPEINAVVIAGDGRCFSAGADISEFGTEPPAGCPTLPETIAAIENLNIPVVAALHGFALGGGLELAMGVHFRIAKPDTKLGLPEVDIGIIPGAGGTQRLPRLVGIKEAARLIAGGIKIDATEAHALGLVDTLIDADDDVVEAGLAFAKTLIETNTAPRPTSQRTDMREDPQTAEAAIEAARTEVSKKARGRIAPQRALDSILNAASLSFDAGMKQEREIFLGLRDGTEARALRHLFRAERAAAKISDLPEGAPLADVRTAAVIGLGTMGQGIALVLARAGIDVMVLEVADDRLDSGLEGLANGLADRVARGRMTQDAMDAELSRITGTTDIQGLADVDLVIEAALEDMEVKKAIFRDLDSVCRGDTILTTNTSSLDIDEFASVTNRPDLIAGAHFFAPAQVMKLLELVRGQRTSPHTMATLMALAKRIGKVGVSVGNAFGFVANRMYHRYTWQAYFMLQEGAQPTDVDAAMQAFGFPLGCLAVGDISGLDVAYHVRQMQKQIGDIAPDMPYPVVADRIVDKGWLGRKTGRGWYTYQDGKEAPDPEVAALIESVSSELGIERRDISDDEIQQRCLFALINEGARLLGSGIAARPGDIDIIWRYGYGFPIWRGGPMFIADEMGLPTVLDTLRDLAAKYGPAFDPAPLIVARVADGKTTLLD